MIRKAKAEHWTEWLEGINEASIWDASRLLMMPATDAGKSRIPTLQTKDLIMKRITCEATNNTSKGQLLYKTFFPTPDQATTPILEDATYPPPHWKFKNITDEQIHRAIKKMKPHKASKKDTVPNSVLIHAKDDLVPHLGPLFRATNMLEYYPQEWVNTETLALKKPGKPDYTALST